MSRANNAPPSTRLASARQVAFDVLLQWEKEGGAADTMIRALAPALADPRDRSLVKTLVYGVLQNRTLLDHLLGQFSRLPLRRLQKTVLCSLRLGLYQLLFLDRIPAPAAINETVAVLKKRTRARELSGLVNAILRNVLRRQQAGQWQPLAIDDPQVRWSHPGWLLKRWRRRFGDRLSTAICRSDNEPPPTVLRVNTLKIGRGRYLELLRDAGIKGEEGAFCPEAVYLIDHRGSPENLPGYREGFFQIQDEGAQLISRLLGPLAAGSYLDGCAGLGGKTGHLAQMLPAGAELVAVEPQRERQELFEENVERLGVGAIALFRGTLQEFSEDRTNAGRFKGILLDAPCSGLGVIRRHPEIRWNRKAEDLPRYSRLQGELLDQAAVLLQPGGLLVYATCSTEPEENEEVIGKFLGSHPEMRQQNCLAYLPEAARSLVSDQGFYRTIPGQMGLDGFFGAVLRREKS